MSSSAAGPRTRTWRTLAVGAATLLALTACGSGGSGSGGGDAKSITLWLSASDAQAAGYTDLAKDFEAAEGISVKIVNVPNDGFQTKLRQAAQANALPDVGRVPSLDPIWTNQLQDLSDVATSDTNKIREDLYIEQDGKVLTIPSDVTAAGLFVNKSLFDQAGVAYPTDPSQAWTWDEFLAAASKVRQATGARYDMVYDASPARLKAFVYEHGSEGIQRQDDGSYAAEDGAVEALEKFAALNDDQVMPKSVWTSGADPNALFKSGQVVAYFSGVWQVADFAQSITQFEWASAATPAQPTQATDLNLGGQMVAFNNSDTAEAAKKFVEFMYDPANYTKLSQTNGYLPVEDGLDLQYPLTQQSALDAFALYNDEISIADSVSSSGFRTSTELVLDGKAISDDPTKDEMAKVINGEQDVEQAVKNIIASFEQQVG